MRRFSRVLPAPIREEQGVCGGARTYLCGRRQFLRKLDSQPKGLHRLESPPGNSLPWLPCAVGQKTGIQRPHGVVCQSLPGRRHKWWGGTRSHKDLKCLRGPLPRLPLEALPHWVSVGGQW
eukprot:6469234-Amphidinium_carterae.2